MTPILRNFGANLLTNSFWTHLLLLLFTNLTEGQQQIQFVQRPNGGTAAGQWYYVFPGQQPQQLQQQQIQFGFPHQQQPSNWPQQPNQAVQFQFGQQQTNAPQLPQFGGFQPQSQQFLWQQPQLTTAQPTQFTQFQQPQGQQQQQQFVGGSFPHPQQQQWPSQQQFQQQPWQQSQQQQSPPNWFIPSFGPGEFQEQLPDLIRPPIVQHVQREPQQQDFGQFPQQQPNNAAAFFGLPNQQAQQPPPPPPPVLLPAPAPPPRIVHIQPQELQPQEFQAILPQLLQTPVLAEQLTPRSTTTTRRPFTTRQPATRRPTTTRPTTRPPPPPTLPPVKVEKESLEFDLPPPPPARFLPESEKIRIAELIRQNNRGRNHANANPIEDDFDLVPSPASLPPSTTTKAPRRSTLARLAAVPADEAPGPQQQDPNRVFLDCCRRKRVAKQCESRCNFDVLNKKILTGLFLGSDKCPTEYGLDLFTCAAQDSDHTTCCRQKRVHGTAAGDKCLAFCNLAPEAPRIQLDVSYLPCWAVLNEVKSCFRENIANKQG